MITEIYGLQESHTVYTLADEAAVVASGLVAGDTIVLWGTSYKVSFKTLYVEQRVALRLWVEKET